jgi:DNA-directed RNA polymerase subunit M/transcription elongation factor TFIIS
MIFQIQKMSDILHTFSVILDDVSKTRALGDVKLKNGTRLFANKTCVDNFLPFLLSNTLEWDDFFHRVKSAAELCTTYTDFIFVVDPGCFQYISACVSDSIQRVVPPSQNVVSKSKCPECGKNTLYELFAQLRSSDEECSLVRVCANTSCSNR